MIIQNKTKHVKGLVDPKSGKKLYLLPGNNQVSAEVWEAVRPHASNEIGKTLIEVAGKTTEKDGKLVIEDKGIKQLSTQEAEAVVAGTYDLKTLNEWKASETRDSIRLAIMKQIDAVEAVGSAAAAKNDK
jgi:hypothetical protein